MAIYYKQDRRAKAELPLWKIAIEYNVVPEDVMWKCRAACFKKDMRNAPMTRQVRMVFPSGTIRYQCTQCGSAVVFDDSDEEKTDTVPESKRESYIKHYRHKKQKLKDAMESRRETQNNR